MKKIVLLLSLSVGTLCAQFKIPYPAEADALSKLKTKSNIKDRLSEIGAADLSQFTIKLVEKKCFTPNSDEVCYNIYRENKAIEGTSYWFAYEIIGKPDKNGDIQKATALVSYTRLNIGQVSCSTRPQFDFEGAFVDPFSLGTKNGLISVVDAEKMILDTLRKGFDAAGTTRGFGEIRGPYPTFCRIDKLKTCGFNEKNCSSDYRVKNEMWQNTHIIAFETNVYEAYYENNYDKKGTRFASMYSMNKMKCLVYCEFERKNGKTVFSKLQFMSDIGNREKLMPERPNEMPYDSVYLPLEKAGIDKIYGRFEAKPAEENSLRYFYKHFTDMADYLNKNLSDDESKNREVYGRYFEKKNAESLAKSYTNDRNAGWKIEYTKVNFDEKRFDIRLKYLRKKKKQAVEMDIHIAPDGLRFENGRWRSN